MKKLWNSTSLPLHVTLKKIISITLEFVIEHVKKNYFPRLSLIILYVLHQGYALHESAIRFKKHYKFDQCVGCVDGTHIPIRKPVNNEVVYVSRYGYHSLNAMVSIEMNNLSYKIK